MIYTCYFSSLGDRTDRAVSVCLQQPPGFHLPVADELAPPLGMLYKFMKGKMSVARFTQLYTMRFAVLDARDIAERYAGKILTAWEGYEDRKKTKLCFSHRHLIADWLRSRGYDVEELS